MLIYEVNLDVDRDAAEAVAAWLPGHIDELLELDGFQGATWYERIDEAGDRVHWTVHYELRDRAALDAYIRDHAARMRQDGLDRFGGRFSASRRVLAPRQ